MSERQQTVLIACNAFEDRARLREGLVSDPAPRYVIIEAESGIRAIELFRRRPQGARVVGTGDAYGSL